MDGKEFWGIVLGDERLTWLGCRKTGELDAAKPIVPGTDTPVLKEDTIYVEGPAGCFAIPVKTVLTEDRSTLIGILLGEREPTIMTHITRIVGYFSRLRDWNGSKIAELVDRRKAYARQAVPCEE